MAHNLFSGEDNIRIPHQILKKFKLFESHRHLFSVHCNQMADIIKDNIIHDKNTLFRRFYSPQQYLDPGDQLYHGKWLSDIVVGS